MRAIQTSSSVIRRVRSLIERNSFQSRKFHQSFANTTAATNLFGSPLTTNTTTVVAPEDIIKECTKIRSSIQVLNDKFKGPLEKSDQQNTILPFIFLLGNHSSGKSSFINYICQRKIQATGVAPTDDGFTVIVPGPADNDKDGPAFVNDPDMGFASLRTFGPQLVHHTRLKIRSNIAFKNFMIVDSPGMIDSPMIRDKLGNAKHAVMDRGYDFEIVCRWFAERADVILLFFDPDKPGTTGETLSILTNSLVGMDHKLHIVLNKADQFRSIHDFARSYGSLCWNLSKVIQRKDLPRIYTMCLPKTYHISPGEEDAQSTMAKGIEDLEETREEVAKEVFNAPKRRVDNEITRLTDSIALLHMHLTIIDDLIKQYKSSTLRSILFTWLAGLSTIAGVGTAFTLGIPFEFTAAIGGFGAATTTGLQYYNQRLVRSKAVELMKEESITKTFKRLYAKRLADKDESLTSLLRRVEDHLLISLTAADFRSLGKVSSSDIQELEKILDFDIPNLRRKASPAFNKSL